MKIHLHQFLSKTGLFKSKKEITNAIKNSEVKVGNKVINNPIYQFNTRKERVFWKNTPLKMLKKYVYILLNKPVGYISSKLTPNDIKLGKKSIFRIIENENKIDNNLKRALFCIGRLDEDASGLLIITNDGQLSSEITDPKNRIAKTYEVLLEKPLQKNDIAKIEQGIIINLEENGKITKYKTRKCRIELINDRKLNITISEGKKREIRRIFSAVGNNVLSLKRISIGRLNLNELNLSPGEYIFSEKGFIEEKITAAKPD